MKKVDALKAINKVFAKLLGENKVLYYYKKSYQAFFKILYINKTSQRGIVYQVQPMLLKAHRNSRPRLSQVFSFYLYIDGNLLPQCTETVWGKNQNLFYSLNKKNNAVELTYHLNGNDNIITLDCFEKRLELFEPDDVRLEPDFSIWPQLSKVDQDIIWPITYTLLNSFLKKLPKAIVSEIKLTTEDSEYTRGVIFLKDVKFRPYDLLIRKCLVNYQVGRDIVSIPFINQIRIIAPDKSSSQLKKLEFYFNDYCHRQNFKKLKQAASNFLTIYKLYLPLEIKKFYFI
jgi:hypothetical protein